jgi:hypothetical protein
MLKILITLRTVGISVLAFFLVACAHSPGMPHGATQVVYRVSPVQNSLSSRFAPVLLAHGCEEDHNRIGTPTVTYDPKGEEEIRMDVEKPAMYWMMRKFTTSKGTYTNLVYRIHFPEVPLRLIPFYLTAGENPGILFIITLDENNRPILFTTSGTCGCYAVTVPTAYLDKGSYPKSWHPEEPLQVYGENLPSLLDFDIHEKPRLAVKLRPDVHRVMGLKIVDERKPAESHSQNIVPTPLLPMEDLEKLPAGMGRTTSLYYDAWPYKGLVKGAFKGWESLTMSLISLDFFVGTDKIYGDSRITGTHFYTSLKPWNREASDLWHFERFLKFNGWNL